MELTVLSVELLLKGRNWRRFFCPKLRMKVNQTFNFTYLSWLGGREKFLSSNIKHLIKWTIIHIPQSTLKNGWCDRLQCEFSYCCPAGGPIFAKEFTIFSKWQRRCGRFKFWWKTDFFYISAECSFRLFFTKLTWVSAALPTQGRTAESSPKGGSLFGELYSVFC